MESIAVVRKPFGSNEIEPELIRIEEKLNSESLRKSKSKEKTLYYLSIGAGALVSTGVGFIGYKFSKKLLDKDEDEKSSKPNYVGCFLFTITALISSRFIYSPKSNFELRKELNKFISFKKMVFPNKFQGLVLKKIQNIVFPCPISCQYPRFPVKDMRTRSDGTPFGRIYDWAALQLVLDEPEGKRSYPDLDNAKFEDFEFCENLCLKIHKLLFLYGEISSGDPLKALNSDLEESGCIKLCNKKIHTAPILIDDEAKSSSLSTKEYISRIEFRQLVRNRDVFDFA